MNRMLRHITFLAAITVCVWLSGLGWYLTFSPAQPPWLFPIGGLAFGLAAVVLTFLWRLGSMLD